MASRSSRLPATSNSGSSSGSNTTSSASARRNLFHAHLSRRPPSSIASTASTTLLESPPDDASPNSSDILVRNANGDYALTAPTLPAVEEGEPVEPEEERKEVEGRLLEMLSNRTKQSSESELLEAVRASLRRKVEALEEDRWIYEGDDGKSGM